MSKTKPHFDAVTTGQSQACMEITSLSQWRDEPYTLSFGLILMVKKGYARIDIDILELQLAPQTMLILFPAETVRLYDVSDEFEVEAVAYSESMLRDASLQIEYMVYDAIKHDRRCEADATAVSLCRTMLSTIKSYGRFLTAEHWPQIVMTQLRSFFMTYYDLWQRQPAALKLRGSQRVHELFGQFMQDVEANYRQSRNVTDYANRLNITTKYLNSITRTVTHRTPKNLIDELVVSQIKLTLRSSYTPLKEIAAEFGFESQTFFTQYFRKHTGTTPNLYREKKK